MNHLQYHNEFIRKSYPGHPLVERIVYLDLETRSELDVKKTGAYVYAAHDSTEIMCASYAIGDGPIHRWKETDEEGLLEAVPELTDPTSLLCFHNAEFETAIFQHCLGYCIPTHRIIDSAAVARHANLPGKLEELGGFFGFPKDMDGNRVMLKLSRPRKPSKSNPDRFWRPDTKPDDFERMYAYCDQDVEVSRHAMNRLPPMSVFEDQVHAATFDMNRRGVNIDRDAAIAMKDTGEREKMRLSSEIEREYGFTLGQISHIASYLGVDSVAKAPLRDLLKDPKLPEDQRRVAEARQTFAKTSLNKLPAFISRSAEDGRARGNLIYGGAERTLRWSGAGIQMQNLTRGIGELQDTAFDALSSGLFTYLYDEEIIDTLSGMLRGLIKEPQGLLVGDYSQIEARMLAWLCDDVDLLDQFRRGLDPYKIMASKIYRKSVEEVTKDERFMGKQTILGCGYGLGKAGFRSMLDATYDVQISLTEADSIVSAYRKNAPKEVKFWKRVERAMGAARSNIGKVVMINKKIGVVFKSSKEMHIILPSKRRLRYNDVAMTREDNGFTKWTCFGKMKNSPNYGKISIYGGALTGHITQSCAREAMAHAIVSLWESGAPLLLTVHDEIVSLKDRCLDSFRKTMETPPDWLTDFPLKVDCFETIRYRK
jgi:DNA polymerase